MIPLILGASVVYFVNTALVSVVLTLVERGSFAEVWKQTSVRGLERSSTREPGGGSTRKFQHPCSAW